MNIIIIIIIIIYYAIGSKKCKTVSTST